MELIFNNKDNLVIKNDNVIIMQELDGRDRVISHGIVSYIENDKAIIYVDNDDFVSFFPFYIVKTSKMIKVSNL